MGNHLEHQTSPYLLQHAENPVDWHPWCDEAFEKACSENKPIFLSVGYSTCHWCHVMAHESFEDKDVAALLNEFFVSIKVDKEERPDVDTVYMPFCQAFTGNGGWPMSVFMTPDRKPFLAGTYFPKTSQYGTMGFIDLLAAIHNAWTNDRDQLLRTADRTLSHLRHTTASQAPANPLRATAAQNESDLNLPEQAFMQLARSFDEVNGGFGGPPKFPMPHNLLFCMDRYARNGDEKTLAMVEKTLTHMYRGGLFDHIGYGFSRYSTDRYYLVPHFEKMLYDNALLIIAYSRAFSLTENELYRAVAEKTATYILREMTSPEGAFYAAQDADSGGVEGKYYVFEADEIIALLGNETGRAFNECFDITPAGNFEGKSIPNLLGDCPDAESFAGFLPQIGEYRMSRNALHLDDKVLTSWNAMMIAAFATLYRITATKAYLEVAQAAQRFLEDNLTEGDTLFVSFRAGQRGEAGFIDDYAYYCYALIALFEATLDTRYLDRAVTFCDKAIADFHDADDGGFYFYGTSQEQLIMRPKETFDGAIPSGNSVMAYNVVKLAHARAVSRFDGVGDGVGGIGAGAGTGAATGDDTDVATAAESGAKAAVPVDAGIENGFEGSTLARAGGYYRKLAEEQLAFMSLYAQRAPAGHCFFLTALLSYHDPRKSVTLVLGNRADIEDIPCKLDLDADISLLEGPTDEYPLLNDSTTFYVCEGRTCKPPTNAL